MLARLALSAVCRLTPLSPEEIADLKLAITEAANDFVDDSRDLDDESRLNFGFHLLDDRLAMELEGPDTSVAGMEQELSRAIIEATVDEVDFEAGRTRLVKYLSAATELGRLRAPCYSPSRWGPRALPTTPTWPAGR